MRIAVLDVGGTTIKSGIWDGQTLSGFFERETRASEGGQALMHRLIDILQELGEFERIGVATAGQVDINTGRIIYANQNIPDYTGTNVREILEETFGVPVVVENDVNAAAIGELHFGAAKNISNFLCLTYGTGIGGAIVINNKVYHGTHWSAGYFGGILIHPELHRAGEELSGCYEMCASTAALVGKAKELNPSLTDGRKIFEAVSSPQVCGVIDDWIDEVVYGLISLIHIFDPQKIVLGGGIMEQKYITHKIKNRTFEMLEPEFRDVEIGSAILGNKAGMLGVAKMATDKVIF